MKVKIIKDINLAELENKINEFTQNNDDYSIKDIKYQQSNGCYSVLILYYEC